MVVVSSRTETAMGFVLVFGGAFFVLVMSLCWKDPYGNSACQLVLGIFAAATLIGGLFFILFVLSKLCDDSSAREREMRRQIALESPRVLMPDDEERRD